jgi:ABC-type uncharacterized transport system permease subunit
MALTTLGSPLSGGLFRRLAGVKGIRGTLARAGGVIVASAAVGSVVILIGHGNPLTVAHGLEQGSIGSNGALVATLAQTTPLVLAALSFAVALRAGVFNAGGQGQFLMGAFGSALAGFATPLAGLPAPLHVLVVLGAGALFGAAWSAVPILLKLWQGTDEILTSLMLSYVAIQLNDWLVLDEFRAPSVQPGANSQTSALAPSARFPELVHGSALTFMALVAVGLCIVAAVYYRRTTPGYESTLVGSNQRFALAVGVNVTVKMAAAMLASGALAGLAGASVVGGFFHADITPFVSNVGFNGILASLLVGNSPLLMPLGAFFFGALQQGGIGLQIFSGQSQYIADVLTAIIIVFIAMRRRPGLLDQLVAKPPKATSVDSSNGERPTGPGEPQQVDAATGSSEPVGSAGSR